MCSYSVLCCNNILIVQQSYSNPTVVVHIIITYYTTVSYCNCVVCVAFVCLLIRSLLLTVLSNRLLPSYQCVCDLSSLTHSFILIHTLHYSYYYHNTLIYYYTCFIIILLYYIFAPVNNKPVLTTSHGLLLAWLQSLVAQSRTWFAGTFLAASYFKANNWRFCPRLTPT